MAKNWEPDISVRGLLNAIRKAEQQRATENRNARRGRDPKTGRAPMFESLIPGSRGAVSPLQGQAKPAAEQSKAKR
jgi:hypothetical protein